MKLTHLFAVRVGNVQARRDCIVEDDIPITGSSYQTLQMLCFFYRVQFSPISSVLAVILGGVQVTAGEECDHTAPGV